MSTQQTKERPPLVAHFYPSIPVLFLDCDGTIRRPDPTRTTSEFINSMDDYQLFPDLKPVADWIIAQQSAAFVSLISNQGGVDTGLLPHRFSNILMERTREDLYYQVIKPMVSVPQEHVVWFSAPFGGWLRKPQIGMLAATQWEVNKRGFRLDMEKSLVVGDRLEDEGVAKAGGIPFKWAWEFFRRPDPKEGVKA